MAKQKQRFTESHEKACETRTDLKLAVVSARSKGSANAQMVEAFNKALRK